MFRKNKEKKNRGLLCSSSHDPLLERFKCSPFSTSRGSPRLISARGQAAALGRSAQSREATAADSSARGDGGGGGGQARARGVGGEHGEEGRARAGEGASRSPTPAGWRTWPSRRESWGEWPGCSWATFGEGSGCSPPGKMN